MALADLLQAIEADAAADREQAERAIRTEATALVEQAREDARRLEADLAAAPEAEARAEAERTRALARLDAATAVRRAQEQAFDSLMAGIQAQLSGLRSSGEYPELFRALLAESRAALPSARILHVDPRDAELAGALETDLRVCATLDSWGGAELVSDDGRTVRNTLEERLENADLLLRRRFAGRS